MANATLARTVDCPECGALAGDRCYARGIIGGLMEQVHADRLRKAQHEKDQNRKHGDLNLGDWRRVEAGLYVALNQVQHMEAETAYQETLVKVQRIRTFLEDDNG